MRKGWYQLFVRNKDRIVRWLDLDLDDFVWKKSINRNLEKKMKGKPALTQERRRQVGNFWDCYKVKFNPNWINFYALCHGKWDPSYIPDDLYYTAIDRHLNNRLLGKGLADKNLLARLYPEVRQPRVILRKINGFYFDGDHVPMKEEQAIDLCHRQEEWVIKPALASHSGDRVVFWRQGQPVRPLLKMGENLVVQEPIRQHQVMKKLHPASINTLRMTTLLIQGKATMVSAVVRMGVDGKRVDNIGAGGICFGIKADGSAKAIAYDLAGRVYHRHPQGACFEACQIPNYTTFVDLAKRLQLMTPHNRFVSWDFAVGEDGLPILIEGNLWMGGIMVHQYCNGPIFGDLTEAVLEEVFGKAPREWEERNTSEQASA